MKIKMRDRVRRQAGRWGRSSEKVERVGDRDGVKKKGERNYNNVKIVDTFQSLEISLERRAFGYITHPSSDRSVYPFVRPKCLSLRG